MKSSKPATVDANDENHQPNHPDSTVSTHPLRYQYRALMPAVVRVKTTPSTIVLRPAIPPGATQCPVSELYYYDDDSFCAQPDPEWDIEGISQQATLEILFGVSGVGKSTDGVARAGSLTSGLDYYGHKV